MSLNDVTVYVACHRPSPHPRAEEGYVAVCNVNADGGRPPGYELYDDEGGLPHLNESFCELSPLHMLVSRETNKYLGLTHYRRIFTSRPVGTATRIPHQTTVAEFDWRQLHHYGATVVQLMAATEGADWVTASPVDVRRLGHASVFEQYVARHPNQQLEICDRIVRSMGYGRSFLPYLKRTTSLRGFNMVIARRELLVEYASFLFPILDACVRELGEADHQSAYDRRWPGFLAERLLNWWLDEVVRPRGLREAHLPVLFLGRGTVVDGIQVEAATPSTDRPRPILSAIDRSLRFAPAPLMQHLVHAERTLRRGALS